MGILPNSIGGVIYSTAANAVYNLVDGAGKCVTRQFDKHPSLAKLADGLEKILSGTSRQPNSFPSAEEGPWQIAKRLETQAQALQNRFAKPVPWDLYTAHQMETVFGLRQEALNFKLQGLIETTTPSIRKFILANIATTVEAQKQLLSILSQTYSERPSHALVTSYYNTLGSYLLCLATEIKLLPHRKDRMNKLLASSADCFEKGGYNHGRLYALGMKTTGASHAQAGYTTMLTSPWLMLVEKHVQTRKREQIRSTPPSLKQARLGNLSASLTVAVGSSLLSTENFLDALTSQGKHALMFQAINQGFISGLTKLKSKLPGGIAPILAATFIEGYQIYKDPKNSTSISKRLQKTALEAAAYGAGTLAAQALLTSAGVVALGFSSGFVIGVAGIAAGCYLSSKAGECFEQYVK